ncbi:hypothetical protein NUW58_g6781 [Xylaria curta]|uniref:Uncharacterized protein n=1 Tax=Xylaria curta TaxID=42375 RepID=A0ACC1NRW6_9PEZI|nr:hypothetical protein NUW58_g6781 [Xylaria curta]
MVGEVDADVNAEEVEVQQANPNSTQKQNVSPKALEQIKRETKAANRAHHLRKANQTRPDQIDALDNIAPGGIYHHDGPYDAALASRNRDERHAPLAAVKEGNREALKATPAINVVDAVTRHVPLQGTASGEYTAPSQLIHPSIFLFSIWAAFQALGKPAMTNLTPAVLVPPGQVDHTGNVMDYEEGADLMREKDAAGGAYKRYDHVQYHPEDLKGKGEPSYTIERDLKTGKKSKD